jgi:hypothetical protein
MIKVKHPNSGLLEQLINLEPKADSTIKKVIILTQNYSHQGHKRMCKGLILQRVDRATLGLVPNHVR